jgi:predicted dehydrogenase
MGLETNVTRRQILRGTAALAASSLVLPVAAQEPGNQNEVELSQIHGAGEQDENAPGPFLAPNQRVGYAIVGLGRLSLDQILPAFGRSKFSQPVALVSGDRAKAQKIAAQYGIPGSSIYDYKTYEQLAANPAVKAIYIVLPNGMHEEYVLRGAKLGKHILCEKPMATTSAEARRMNAACQSAGVKLMIAYRQQYEPHNRALRTLVTKGKLGPLRGLIASNSQRQGDLNQWRLKKSLAGGGCLPDVGLYCINAARFLSGEEPIRVAAQLWQPKDDPRFREVEASMSFSMQFPSGYVATCTTSYDVHKSQVLRLEGTDAWAELNPAFGYHGNKLRWSKLDNAEEMLFQPQIEEKDQFALEMDHFSECILENKEPHTPGRDGVQDHIIEAARIGKSVELALPMESTRDSDVVS